MNEIFSAKSPLRGSLTDKDIYQCCDTLPRIALSMSLPVMHLAASHATNRLLFDFHARMINDFGSHDARREVDSSTGERRMGVIDVQSNVLLAVVYRSSALHVRISRRLHSSRNLRVKKVSIKYQDKEFDG